MSTSFFIARRYLFSKKSANVINVISGISIIGVAIATMALVVVMSVFNGFSDLVASFFTSFDPQIEVVPTNGKTCPADDPVIQKIKELDIVDVASESLEDQALAMYGNHQAMVTIKGVDDNFQSLTKIDDICYGEGSFELHAADLQYGVMGIRLASVLGVGTKYPGYMQVYAPEREGQFDAANPMGCFVVDSLLSPGVVFCVNQSRYDSKYILTSLHFARMLFQRDGEISSLELKLKPGVSTESAKKKIQAIIASTPSTHKSSQPSTLRSSSAGLQGKNSQPSTFKVLDRYEQQAETFNIMKIEKLMAYIFLTFILIVASFNIIGSLSMLIIDKQKDVKTLRSLGARDSLIKKIFILEGWLISIVGAILGVILGLILCGLQQQYGFVKLGKESGTFIIDAYPVSVHYGDVAFVFLTVLVVGFISVLYPVRYALKKHRN